MTEMNMVMSVKNINELRQALWHAKMHMNMAWDNYLRIDTLAKADHPLKEHDEASLDYHVETVIQYLADAHRIVNGDPYRDPSLPYGR